MNEQVSLYRKRREARIRERFGDKYEDMKRFHERRNGRLVTRFDENPRLIYEIAKRFGIEADGLSGAEVMEAINKQDPTFNISNVHIRKTRKLKK